MTLEQYKAKLDEELKLFPAYAGAYKKEPRAQRKVK